MTIQDEPKTLAELNLKPGDVVRYEDRQDRTFAGIAENGNYYHTEQKFGGFESMSQWGKWTLVSRATPSTDLTTITTPFGLLDEVTQTALRVHGGPYLCLTNEGWITTKSSWQPSLTYRVKPGPKRETIVNREMYITSRGTVACNAKLEGARPVTMKYDTIDGKIDIPSFRLEER